MHWLSSYRSWVVGVVFVLFVLMYALVFAPPSDFPKDSVIEIGKGTSLIGIANQLHAAHVISHPRVLWFMLRVEGLAGQVQAGRYLFDTPENVFTVAYRLATGSSGIPPMRLTFPEGSTVRDMAILIASSSEFISEKEFLAAGKQYEGYLFPDTYFFGADATIDSIIETMRGNFDKKTEALLPSIHASGHSLSDIVIMASLIEKEARTTVNRKLVAGVLWNRIKLGMPLQVDAVFGYIHDRDTYSPTYDDLKVKSPYNTYLNTGLPPGAIDNPGLDSLLATLNPTKTNYLYYLTDKNGVMHYATTYAEHQANQNTYLR